MGKEQQECRKKKKSGGRGDKKRALIHFPPKNVELEYLVPHQYWETNF